MTFMDMDLQRSFISSPNKSILLRNNKDDGNVNLGGGNTDGDENADCDENADGDESNDGDENTDDNENYDSDNRDINPGESKTILITILTFLTITRATSFQ